MNENSDEFYLFSDMDLLPCPICGAKAKPVVTGSFLNNGYLTASFYIKCGGERHCISSPANYRICIDTKPDGSIIIEHDDRQFAQDTWNKRNNNEHQNKIKPLDLSIYENPELLPCPVCGKKAEFFIVNKSQKTLFDLNSTLPPTGFLFGIRCTNSEPCFEFKSKESVIFDLFTNGRVIVTDNRKKLQKEWNTRSTEDLPAETKAEEIEQSKIQKSDALLKKYYGIAQQADEQKHSSITAGIVFFLIVVVFILILIGFSSR